MSSVETKELRLGGMETFLRWSRDWGRAQESRFNRLPEEGRSTLGAGSAAGTKAGNMEKQGRFRAPANCNGDSDVQ